MSALGFFRGKTVFIAGATLPLGMSLCHRLADLGAIVIALDTDDILLASVARHAPDRIETLTLDLTQERPVSILRDAWGDEPVQVLFNLLPLAQPPQATEGLFSALDAALMAGRARAVSVFKGAPANGAPQQAFDAAGWRAFLGRLEIAGAHHRALEVSRRAHMAPSRVTSVGDLALMLCHPASDALSDQSVLAMTPAD